VDFKVTGIKFMIYLFGEGTRHAFS
jgi:hypothetical protein